MSGAGILLSGPLAQAIGWALVHLLWQGVLVAAVLANAHLSQFVLGWMTGVLLLSLRLLCGWARAHRIATRDAVEATPHWQRAARRLAHALRIRNAIHLLESAAVEVPTVIGWLR